MNNNLKFYNAVREVPKEATKPIGGGKLKGMTDINPMWRIKTLTEQFGMCGIGWYIEVVDKWQATNFDNNEVSVFVSINLFVKVDGEWSKPIFGLGGSMATSIENKTNWDTKEKEKMLVSNDEAYKMAYTDAISVACKALGMGANIYFEKDRTKYDRVTETEDTEKTRSTKINKIKVIALEKLAEQKGIKPTQLTTLTNSIFKKTHANLNEEEYLKVIKKLEEKPDVEETKADTISTAQATRMFAIAKGNAQVCKDVAKEYGYEHSKDILKKDYDNIIKQIEEKIKE